jgi:YbbR domain-containing protein
LRIKGTGYALLSNKINPPLINLDVNDFSLYSQSKDSLTVYLISRFAREWFSNEVNLENASPLEIISISPDTISFNFTRTYSKKVPVALKYYNQQDVFARQHMQNGKILIEPDSILIIGPANLIDALNYISTKPLKISELKDTASKKIDIEVNQGIKYSSERVRVTIPVDRFTESTLEVPISAKNLPDSIRIKTFPRTVNITYNVTLTMYNMVSETDFYPYVDYLDITKNITSQEFKLKVHLDSAPDYIHSVSFRPKNVEFLIERNDDKNRIDRGNR